MTGPRAIPPNGSNSTPRLRPHLGEEVPRPASSEARDFAVAALLRSLSFAVSMGTIAGCGMALSWIIHR